MRLPHVTPFAHSPLYFFTACTANRRPLLANAEAFGVLLNLWTTSAERDGWFVGRFMLMPDHVHLFAQPATHGARLREAWLKMWKSVSSRQLAVHLGFPPPLWQPDTFDHLLRSAESYTAKWDYVRANPVRAALVPHSDTWPWQGEVHRLAFR